MTLLNSFTNGSGCSMAVTQVWRATELCCGSSSTCERTVSALPVAPSFVSCSNLTYLCNSAFPTNPPLATDPCCSNVVVTLLNSFTNGSGCSMVVTQVWQATELCCGASSTCTRTVTALPGQTNCLSIQYPSNFVVMTCSNTAQVFFPPPSFTDPCCSTSSITYKFRPPYNTFTVGTSHVSLVANDNCGNYAATSFAVTVLQANCPTNWHYSELQQFGGLYLRHQLPNGAVHRHGN